jgi:hypothetical protein
MDELQHLDQGVPGRDASLDHVTAAHEVQIGYLQHFSMHE